MPRYDRDRRDEYQVDADVLWALANVHNRHVLRYFDESDHTKATVTDLAEDLATEGRGPFRDDPRRAKIHLHHASLPKLDDLGIVDYDPKTGVVRKPNERVLPADLVEDVLALDADD